MRLVFPSLPMIFRETLEEINDQRKEEKTNVGLVDRLERQTKLLRRALDIGDSPEEIVQASVTVAALAARIAAEGDPAYPKYRWPYE
mgnify:CR=1 FL=1